MADNPPIVAAVIYYRPRIKDLQRLCDSLEGRVDAAVFVDGPFEGVASDVKTIRAERDILRDFGTRVQCYISESHIFADEAAKRTYAARIAFELYPHDTHLLVIDSDEELLTDIPIPEPGMLGVARIFDPKYHLIGGSATMIRLHDLTSVIRWGPSHFEVSNRGLRYATPHGPYHKKHSFEIYHYGNLNEDGSLRELKDLPGYQEYNDKIRMKREALGRNGEGEYAIPSFVWASDEDTIYGGLMYQEPGLASDP